MKAFFSKIPLALSSLLLALFSLSNQISQYALFSQGIWCLASIGLVLILGRLWLGKDQTKEDLKNTFGGCCTEMEGAAIAQVAYLNGMKALIVRAISDKADDSASMDYDEFERKAIENCVKLTTRLIETIDTSCYCQ